MYITKILYLLAFSQKKKFFLLIFFTIINSFLEMISLGLVFPIFKIIVQRTKNKNGQTDKKGKRTLATFL